MDIIEQKVAKQLIDAILAAGCSVAVDYGEGDMTSFMTDGTAILAELGECEEEYLVVKADGKIMGRVFLVWGNDADLICDYTTTLEHIVDPVVDRVNAEYN